MGQIFPKWWNRLPMAAAIGGAVGLVLVVLGIWYYFSPKYTDVGYMPQQPIQFSHKFHAGEMGLDCLYCHNTVEHSPFAAVPPSENACWGCHQNVAKDSPKLRPLREAVESGKPIEWVNVHMLPDYVRFDHSAHLGAGVGCVSCHGKVNEMEEVFQAKPMSMSWCLDCHRGGYKSKLRPMDKLTDLDWDNAKYNPFSDPHRKRPASELNPPTNCSACHY